MIGSKKCYKCGELKARADFNKHKSRKDGLQSTCKSCDKEKRLAYYAANKEREKGKGRAWYAANKERAKEKARAWRAANKERHKEMDREWRKANPDKANALRAKRRAQRLKATPAWLTDRHKEEIISFYSLAASLTKETGTEYHVDHIVPLQGDNVCGLHVPWNLQVLTATENIKKGNRACESI